jgi:hypothetical protein
MMIWNRFWHALGRILTQSSDLSVTQRRDDFGNESFRVYDPMTRKYSAFSSEQEIRIWLEQRYYGR